MNLTELLTESRTLCHTDIVSKKRALELASETLAGQPGAPATEQIFSGLLNRERLGSTGIGDGVAIPHCRLADCHQAMALLMTLATPIDFDAIDNRPVDLLCVLLVPEDGAEEHLQTLAGLAELFSQADVREQLRSCEQAAQLYQSAHELADAQRA
ncbi:PTS IIA-like nitrogen-regulatory protein PtsN [Marinobacterium lacunae]|uniref:PTS IIA-like nitrogen-regulatory protein PtsN n=1 Tax=Marinobacterium lacunae TaxID=1232683 RepID=A0A081FXL0_9GAMM|nr:PTS sugar transporter subunit IIA [Marinobacterium lacunae]KEA63265.1 PTS IIA-like nitrogen-regulatory protein PtsN [Marinobacterium lacunae]